jgi:hypothetical protein
MKNIRKNSMTKINQVAIALSLLVQAVALPGLSQVVPNVTEAKVEIKITQTFVSDAERKQNHKNFEQIATSAALKLKKREGVWTQLAISDTGMKELLESARDFKDVLEKGVKKITQLRLNDRLAKYVDLMNSVVVESDNATSELLMRYALNRGMAVQELFSNEKFALKADMSREALKSLELRVLRDAVDRAIVLYAKDEKFLDILKNTKVNKEKNQEMKSKLGFDLFEVSKLEFERDYANYIVEITTNAPTHNGTFQLLKYTVIQLFNGINSSLLRNQSQKLKNILRNLYELGIELPEDAPNDPLTAHSLNNMTKDNLELIIKDFNLAMEMLRAELRSNYRELMPQDLLTLSPNKISEQVASPAKSQLTIANSVDNIDLILISAIADTNENVRNEALKSINKVKLNNGHLEQVRKLKASSNLQVRQEAATLLYRINSFESITDLISMMSDNAEDVRIRVHSHLDVIKMTDEHIPALIKHKSASNNDLRKQIVIYLGKISTSKSLNNVVSMFADNYEDVRIAVKQQMNTMTFDESYLPTLVSYTSNSNWTIRRDAAFYIHKIAGDKATLALIKLMSDSFEDVRTDVYDHLAKRKLTNEMVAALQAQYTSSIIDVRVNVTICLARISSINSTEAMLQQLSIENNGDVKTKIISSSSKFRESN